MISLLLAAAIIGLFVLGISGIGFLGLAAGGIIFLCGLPFALIGDFVHGEVSYAQDRADYRTTMSDIAAEELETEAEYAADDRIDRLVAAVKKKQRPNMYDNRQVHIHNGG